MSFQGFNEGPLTYKAGEAIAPNLLVTLTSTAGTVGLCGTSGYTCGVSTDAVASGGYGSFQPVRGRVLVTAGDTGVSGYSGITAGDLLVAGVSGTVVQEDTPSTRTVRTVGQAETAAGTSGTLWMVCPL